MQKSFWNELPHPFFALAPMEAVTDVVFRHVIAAAAPPDIYFTEFTNAASYCSPAGEQSTRGRLTFTHDEHPIIAQIWGNNPKHFEQMSLGLAKQGFAGIDINMGCPDRAVIKNGCGSALIRQPELASELISAAKAGGLPVSVKTRLGYSKTDEWQPWLTHLLLQDIANLTIHLRTTKEMSKVPAHFELISGIKTLRDEIAPQTLITINGDIRDRQQGELLACEYDVDGIMIGRGVFQNPFAFKKSDATTPSDAQSETEETRKNELVTLLRLHLDLFDTYSQELEPRKFDPLKRFFKIYVRDFPGAAELRDQLMHTKNTDEVRALLNI